MLHEGTPQRLSATAYPEELGIGDRADSSKRSWRSLGLARSPHDRSGEPLGLLPSWSNQGPPTETAPADAVLNRYLVRGDLRPPRGSRGARGVGPGAWSGPAMALPQRLPGSSARNPQGLWIAYRSTADNLWVITNHTNRCPQASEERPQEVRRWLDRTGGGMAPSNRPEGCFSAFAQPSTTTTTVLY